MASKAPGSRQADNSGMFRFQVHLHQVPYSKAFNLSYDGMGHLTTCWHFVRCLVKNLSLEAVLVIEAILWISFTPDIIVEKLSKNKSTVEAFAYCYDTYVKILHFIGAIYTVRFVLPVLFSNWRHNKLPGSSLYGAEVRFWFHLASRIRAQAAHCMIVRSHTRLSGHTEVAFPSNSYDSRSISILYCHLS